MSRNVRDLTAAELDELLEEWRFREVTPGVWRGYHPDGRKTGLKTARKATKTEKRVSALELAQQDVLDDRLPCAAWPWCEHESVDKCVAARRWAGRTTTTATARRSQYQAEYDRKR